MSSKVYCIGMMAEWCIRKMAIQWYPGHMYKTHKVLVKRVAQVDVIIEMLDARLPASSSNPLLATLGRGKPTLKILNKQDLADTQTTALWLKHFNAKMATQALALNAKAQGAIRQKLMAVCRALAPRRLGLEKPLRVLICGVPNVGKSTLINSLLGRRLAKMADEPGVTKFVQRILLADDFELFDSPGMLWPKITVEEGGFNLAASGAVGRNALDEENVCLALLNYLVRHYSSCLQSRYSLPPFNEAVHGKDVLAAIATRRGALLEGGKINYQKAAELVLTDFRAGSLGRITLERPEEWAMWETHASDKW